LKEKMKIKELSLGFSICLNMAKSKCYLDKS
jgi:hypothetical protein